jgi:hypothetical protein
MMSRARVGFLAAACLLMPAGLWAADASPPAPPPAPVATMVLKDGRVLHNVKVMSDDGDSVFVKADEGLLQIKKSDLPQAAPEAIPQKAPTPAASEYVMQRFDPNQAPEAPPPAPGAKPTPKPGAKPAPGPKPVASSVYKGCTIMSFQMKPFQNVQGCVEVVIQNDTDENTLIRPSDFVCISADGARHVGRNIIAQTFPPSVRRRELVPAHGEVDDIVTFTNEALDISGVQWSK